MDETPVGQTRPDPRIYREISGTVHNPPERFGDARLRDPGNTGFFPIALQKNQSRPLLYLPQNTRGVLP